MKGIKMKNVITVILITVFALTTCSNEKTTFTLTQHPDINSETGWTDLLEPDLSNCFFEPGSWEFQDGVLALTSENPGGKRYNIWTKETYSNFMLDFEFKLDTTTNSGVFFRTVDINNPVQTGIEVQMMDSYGKESDTHTCGAIYDCLAPSENTVYPAGEWNRCTIAGNNNKIYVILNNKQIIAMDLDLWTEAGKNPDGTKNKFNTAYKDMARTGHIGFQDHGHLIWYRNLKIKPLKN
jgi:hypothetical protein